VGADSELFDPYVFWPLSPRMMNPFAFLRAIRTVRAFAARRHVSLIHANNVMPVQASLPAARSLRIPIVGHIRGILFRSTRWLSGIRHCDRILAISKSVAQGFQRLLDNGRLRVLYNGIDLSRYVEVDRPPGGRSGKGWTIGTVAFLRPQKGIDDLLRMAALGLRQGYSFQVRIAGSGADAERLQRLAGELGIRDQTEFVGHIEDVPRFLASLDVFVMLSHFEALGNSAIEASASGLPCIVSDAGGLPEVVQDGHTGYVVPVFDYGMAWDRLSRLMDDPRTAARMGQRGRERAQTLFSEDAYIQGVRDTYRECLAEATGPR
jgi:glycosyltransferase involved in cell wall biosynthesis